MDNAEGKKEVEAAAANTAAESHAQAAPANTAPGSNSCRSGPAWRNSWQTAFGKKY